VIAAIARMTGKQTLSVCILAMLVLMALSAATPSHGQTTSPGFNDAVIGQRVRTAINTDRALRIMDIIIDVHDRVVRLSGFVNTMADLAKAEELARGVEGVTAVSNAIRVTNRPSRA
jgi:osmotically-inducible protein OsmY